MGLEDQVAQSAKQEALLEKIGRHSIFDDIGAGKIEYPRVPTTKELLDRVTAKIDADKEPLDKEGQELRRRIDKDIIEGNYEDISKILSTAKPEELEKVMQKVCGDLSGENIRSYPRLTKTENGDPCLYIRLGTPPYACYFGERAISITAKGVEFVDASTEQILK